MKILNSLKSLGDGEGRRPCRSLEAAAFWISDLAQAEQHRGGRSWDLASLGSVSAFGVGLVGIKGSVPWFWLALHAKGILDTSPSSIHKAF